MSFFSKKKKVKPFALGKLVPIESVPDEVFSQKMMGDGIAIIPQEGKIYSPLSGQVVMTLKGTNHAIGLKTDKQEFLIHVSINTELIENELELHVEKDDFVEAGQLLISYNQECVRDKGINDITMLVILSDENESVKLFTETNIITSLRDTIGIYK